MNGKSNTYRKGYAAEIRRFGGTRETFSIKDLYDLFNVFSHEKKARSIRNTVWDMRKRGEIVHVSVGSYRLITAQSPRAGVRCKIYRAMSARKVFSASDIKILSDADSSYILSVARRLVKAGHLAKTGGRKNLKGYPENMFRVVHPDKFYIEFVLESR